MNLELVGWWVARMDGRWQSDLAWSYILTIEIYIHALHYIGVKQK